MREHGEPELIQGLYGWLTPWKKQLIQDIRHTFEDAGVAPHVRVVERNGFILMDVDGFEVRLDVGFHADRAERRGPQDTVRLALALHPNSLVEGDATCQILAEDAFSSTRVNRAFRKHLRSLEARGTEVHWNRWGGNFDEPNDRTAMLSHLILLIDKMRRGLL